MEKKDIIELTRELGKAIQSDERYKVFVEAKKASEQDKELQDLIGEFNLASMSIDNEMQKPEGERDGVKIREYNENIRNIYGKVMQNDNMIAYNSAKADYEKMLKRIKDIIELCADGEDPETCEPEEISCTGNCASCGGCH